MVDTDALLRTLALRSQRLTAVIGARFYVGELLPSGYTPALAAGKEATAGPAVLMTARPGPINATSVKTDPAYEAKCYALSKADAMALDALLLEELHQKAYLEIRRLRCEVPGRHVPDPENTGWHWYLSTWKLTVVIGATLWPTT